ncbi:MAG TPA: oligopeptide transporter, OPT family [bacterium]|nr:oligopeptide transporter, OPT family [bacterium]HPN45810.1 oligopeptide transporter, OPT family [bacterium]
MADHQPYISADANPRDFTLKAIISGMIFGIIFGSANAYLGLRVGLTISTAIPLAVVSVALFRILQPLFGPSNVLEQNITQTVGSSSSSLASGVIFTIPALFLWGFDPSLLQIGTLAILGGLLGVLFMIPLRRFLIVKEHETLPYPEGTAAAQVLIAADAGGAKAKNVFWGLGIGALYKGMTGFLRLWPETIHLKLPVLRKAEIGLEAGPALLGVGYILGYRVAAIMVAGGLLSWVGLIPLIDLFGKNLTSPLFPETELLINDMSASQIWTRYIRYIGAGAVACAGIITVCKSIPTMFRSLKIGLQEFRLRSGGTMVEKIRTDRDLPITVVLGGVALVVLVIISTPHVLGISAPFIIRLLGALCIALFAFMFVTVSSRIVGLVGVSSNPTSGMTIVTLLGTSLLFYALGWTDNMSKAAVLTIGTVVCVAASIAGDISQDLKCGYIIGATPRKQQTAEIIGAATSAFFIAGSVWLLGRAYTFGSVDLPAPQATLMKTVIEGVLQADLPWGLVLTGAAIAGVAELLGTPSLPFAVGIYLPLSAMTPVFVGGCIRYFIEKSAGSDDAKKASRKEQGILLGSGLIAGEGIMGVCIAAFAFFAGKPRGIGLEWAEPWGQVVSLGVFILLGAWLVNRATRKN